MMRTAIRDALIIIVAAAALVAAARSTSVSRQAARQPGHLVVASNEATPAPPDATVLRVCADPNNLPFSNDQQQGFENELARLVADALGRRLEYYWQPQRRGFIRTTLNAGWCDVVMGLPARAEMALTTRPYYRSTYVFVTHRNGRAGTIRSLDDPRLRRLRLGVEMTGEDYENPPAVQSLASRHIIDNVRPYLVYGDYSQPNPPRRIIDAVASGEVDAAIAWGPLAGYFAAQSAPPLALEPVTPQRDGPGLSFAFDIAMGVRRKDRTLHDALDQVIAAHAAGIETLLRRFHVPILTRGEAS